jgi:hypothetical protein
MESLHLETKLSTKAQRGYIAFQDFCINHFRCSLRGIMLAIILLYRSDSRVSLDEGYFWNARIFLDISQLLITSEGGLFIA